MRYLLLLCLLCCFGCCEEKVVLCNNPDVFYISIPDIEPEQVESVTVKFL